MADEPNLAGLKISAEILKLIGGIDELNGAWRAIGRLAPERLSALRHVASIESIGSSTRIEGSKLTDRQVERLLSNVEIRNFANRNEQEVIGSRRGGHPSGRGLSDRLPLRHAAPHDCAGGVDEQDTERRNTAPARGHRSVHRDIPCHSPLPGRQRPAVAHPDDAPLVEKRLRLCALCIAGKRGRSDEGSLLPRASPHAANLGHETPEWEPWLQYFLGALFEQKARLEKKLEQERLLLGDLPELSAKILELCKSRGRISVGEIEKATKANRGTIKDHLAALVKAGHLALHGAGRGAYYALA